LKPLGFIADATDSEEEEKIPQGGLIDPAAQ
jgi:hypothetical protein